MAHHLALRTPATWRWSNVKHKLLSIQAVAKGRSLLCNTVTQFQIPPDWPEKQVGSQVVPLLTWLQVFGQGAQLCRTSPVGQLVFSHPSLGHGSKEKKERAVHFYFVIIIWLLKVHIIKLATEQQKSTPLWKVMHRTEVFLTITLVDPSYWFPLQR